ncbi:SH3 domain-containing protein [Madurella fahalii]|uniref:SH3 domain-containing protein n=1 Tax=Madurella fahalii TaxID=1157608 RepID=A0ABQ0GBU3_9PEZI
MDGVDSDQEDDHRPESAASRAISTNTPGAPGSRYDPSRSGTDSMTATERRGSLSFRPLSQTYSVRGYSGISDGIDAQTPQGKGKEPFQNMAPGGPASAATSAPSDGGRVNNPWLVQGSSFTDMNFTTPRQFARPPPPPPLTPPNLDDPVYPFQDRRPSCAISIPPGLDTSFIHQPNPEYLGSSTSTDMPSSSPQSTTAIPRRRSYTKSVPISIPMPTAVPALASTETVTLGSTFSPSSYPPTSPLLPPPPPGHDALPEYQFVGGPGGPGVFLSQEEIDVHGEIISVTDHAGHGWKRHTRVYGGGVCLACLAAGEEGGFYGATVPLEDRR